MGQFGKQPADEESKITVRTETLDTEPSAVAPDARVNFGLRQIAEPFECPWTLQSI